jgi:hypothetical protein
VTPQTPVPYRAPTIALVQPTGASPIPRDKPIVVFRFAQGESDDPVDARSFAVSVNGVDRSSRFQVAADEAWGSLASASPDEPPLLPGPHAVIARICSVRGACAVAGVSVTIDAGAATGQGTVAIPQPADQGAASSRARLIARVLDAIRKILVP